VEKTDKTRSDELHLGLSALFSWMNFRAVGKKGTENLDENLI
jgi:hypothetical protein